MFTVIVGECSTGKTSYLHYLRRIIPNSYLIGYDCPASRSVDVNLSYEIFGGVNGIYPVDAFGDKASVPGIMEDMCRKCTVLLIDELGAQLRYHHDAYLLTTYVYEISKTKDVYMVTHDNMKLYNADRIVTVHWDGDIPLLYDVTLEDAEVIVHG